MMAPFSVGALKSATDSDGLVSDWPLHRTAAAAPRCSVHCAGPPTRSGAALPAAGEGEPTLPRTSKYAKAKFYANKLITKLMVDNEGLWHRR